MKQAYSQQDTNRRIRLIMELRQKAEDQLGERFDIRQFHNVVLTNGSVPLTILEELVDQYIAEANG